MKPPEIFCWIVVGIALVFTAVSIVLRFSYESPEEKNESKEEEEGQEDEEEETE